MQGPDGLRPISLTKLGGRDEGQASAQAPAGVNKILQYSEDREETTPYGDLTFRSYQRRAVTFLSRALSSYGLAALGFRANGAMYAAAAGLGKTPLSMQTLRRLGLLDEPLLICAPLQARETWCGETADPALYFGLQVAPITKQDLKTGSRIRFVHYEILAQVEQGLRRSSPGPRTLIFDESHMLANPHARCTQAARALSGMASVQYRLLLTATPIRSGRHNLHSQLDIMQPNQWGSWIGEEFGPRYCGMEQERTQGHQIYWVMKGPTNSGELRQRLDRHVLKISRGTAAAHGGTRIERISHWVHLTGPERGMLQEAILEASRLAAKSRRSKEPEAQYIPLGGGRRLKIEAPKAEGYKRYPSQLVAMTHALSAMAKIKVAHAAQVAVDALKVDRKFVVFTERRESADMIARQCKQLGAPSVIGPIDGKMPVQKRWDLCEYLGLMKMPAILVATASSIGVSNHSLKVATGCLIATPFWNPDANIQVEGRLLSEGDNVKVKRAIYLFLENNPVDTRILERIAEKEQDAADILDVGPEEGIGKDLGGISESFRSGDHDIMSTIEAALHAARSL